MAAKLPIFRLSAQSFLGPSRRCAFQTVQTVPILSRRSFGLSAARGARNAANPPPPRTPRKTPQGQLSMPMGSIGRLALKVAREGDIVLFRAPSHRAYVIGAYGIGVFCFAYAIFNSYDVFTDAKIERPQWQRALFGGVVVFMSAFGTWIFSRTTHLVRNITAIKTNTKQTPVKLRFAVRRMIPFTKPYILEVAPSQVSIQRRLVVSVESMRRFEKDSKMTPTEEPQTGGFFKAPGRVLSTGIWRVFMSLRQLFTSEDFILLNIEGHSQSFRVDSNGFVSMDFLALGNPVQYQKE